MKVNGRAHIWVYKEESGDQVHSRRPSNKLVGESVSIAPKGKALVGKAGNLVNDTTVYTQVHDVKRDVICSKKKDQSG